jgi:Protein of unknown function (DUF2635)
MRAKPVDPDAVIRDPVTQRQLPAEGGEVPDTSFWRRRLLAGEIELVDEQQAPTGREPVTPLTTR